VQQTKVESFIEACLNTASGFIVSWTFWLLVIVPVFHLSLTHAQNFTITCMFTVLSILRSYIWRRFFNAGLHRVVHKVVRNYASKRYL
jgi:membrane protein implicated in regulation of membrane protease activity